MSARELPASLVRQHRRLVEDAKQERLHPDRVSRRVAAGYLAEAARVRRQLLTVKSRDS